MSATRPHPPCPPPPVGQAAGGSGVDACGGARHAAGVPSRPELWRFQMARSHHKSGLGDCGTRPRVSAACWDMGTVPAFQPLPPSLPPPVERSAGGSGVDACGGARHAAGVPSRPELWRFGTVQGHHKSGFGDCGTRCDVARRAHPRVPLAGSSFPPVGQAPGGGGIGTRGAAAPGAFTVPGPHVRLLGRDSDDPRCGDGDCWTLRGVAGPSRPRLTRCGQPSPPPPCGEG